MLGLARVVISGIPHHVTQRGNNRKRIFFTDNDYQQSFTAEDGEDAEEILIRLAERLIYFETE